MDIEEEIASVAINVTAPHSAAWSALQGSEHHREYVRRLSLAIAPLLNRVRAEALREAAEWKREHNLGNAVWGDYLKRLAEEKYQAGGDDMITIWLDDRADRIEQNSEGNET